MRIIHLLFCLICILFILVSNSFSIGILSYETTREIEPGIIHTHRQLTDPLENIHILKIDLTKKEISFKAVLGGEKIGHPETVSSMVKRTGAIAGINGDYWSGDGIYAAPEGIMVSDGELITAPKYRTALGISKDNKVFIQKWTDDFEWDGEIVFPNGEKHHINLVNRWDLNENSMILYTPRWSTYSFGTSRGIPATEILFEDLFMDEVWRPRKEYLNVGEKDIRINKEGIKIHLHINGTTFGMFLLAGRGESAIWLKNQFDELSTDRSKPFDPKTGFIRRRYASLSLTTNPMWYRRSWPEVTTNIYNAISAGPLIVDEGTTYRDPILPFSTNPVSEDFTVAWKRNYYLNRNPHSAAGITKDGKTLILMTVDGRQKEFSQGFTRDELAEYMISLGAYRALGLDSGGSTTMVIQDQMVNHPSDKAKPDGTGGIERKVINSLCIFHSFQEK